MKGIGFGREVTSHLEAALKREWLVTNGIGGYASASVVGVNTRRYHGLLVASLPPPLGRTLLVSKLNTLARLGDEYFALTTNEYSDGTIDPHGYQNLESFVLEGSIPVFTWAAADALLEQRVWMVHGQNSTYVTFTLVRASRPLALEIVPLCTYRPFDQVTDARGWMPNVRPVKGGGRIDAGPEAVPYWLRTNRGTFVPGVVRHWSFRHRTEGYRGLDDREDLFAVGRLDAKLGEGETLALLLTTVREAEMDWQAAFEAEQARQAQLLACSGLDDAPGWVRRLALAADQFVVDYPHVICGAPGEAGEGRAMPAAQTGRRRAIVAGYPWFGERQRDSMIALPGLTLATGRAELAAEMLRTWARDWAPDAAAAPGQAPDAPLWFFYALQAYVDRTQDGVLIRDLYPRLVAVIEAILQSRQISLSVDPADQLLYHEAEAGGLTWMDAHDGERFVTPRVGKPVEVNALWCNALGLMARLANRLERPEDAIRWQALAEDVAQHFGSRFWYAEGGYLYDVIDGPEGNDATLRPNQILAVALPCGPLKSEKKKRSVVDTVARYLQTSYGLRTLSRRDPAYAQRYGGNWAARQAAYHQGSVWAWLSGPFVAAHLNVYGDRAKARSFLRPFEDHAVDHGVGSISEIFDGDPPHTPRGCIAQAASVAQVLCGWLTCSRS